MLVTVLASLVGVLVFMIIVFSKLQWDATAEIEALNARIVERDKELHKNDQEFDDAEVRYATLGKVRDTLVMQRDELLRQRECLTRTADANMSTAHLLQIKLSKAIVERGTYRSDLESLSGNFADLMGDCEKLQNALVLEREAKDYAERNANILMTERDILAKRVTGANNRAAAAIARENRAKEALQQIARQVQEGVRE